MLDTFYPASDHLKDQYVAAILGMVFKLREHRLSGNQSKLANRLGQLRRNVADFTSLPEDLQEEVKIAIFYLRSSGRTVNLGSADPREWISTTTGLPRW
jgi:hypothetical protein